MARRKTQTDEAILDAAARAIERVGPIRMTLADVAAESGLAPATLVQRFGSKAGLLAATFRLGNDRLRATIETLPERPVDDGPLITFLVEIAPAFADPATMADNLLILSEDLRDPVFGTIARERSRLLRAAAEKLLPDIAADRPAAARMVEAQWHGAVIQAALAGEAEIPKAVAAALAALLATIRAAAKTQNASKQS
jgi:AcrR family transcriptional regulator